MARMNFFERMEREIDFQEEYEKIEDIILNEPGSGYSSINEDISKAFRNWKDRRNYTSFDELRNYIGFSYLRDQKNRYLCIPTSTINGIDDFLLYCEMILNLCISIMADYGSSYNHERVITIIDTMIYDLEKINHEIHKDEKGRVIIVQKNAATTAVVDIVETDLGDAIIEYNHHLLKGDIEAKKTILKKIADALEPKREALKNADKTIEKDFFYMVNNMNVRHNNCDPADAKNYNEKFASLSSEKQEEWYDEIYQEGLMAFLCLEQVERKAKIDAFKQG